MKATPSINPESKEFWESANNGVFKMQYCIECEKAQYYPRSKCKFCHSFELDYKQFSKKGQIVSYSIVYRGPSEDYPVPYTLGLVNLEDGTKIFGRIIHNNPLKMGTEVEVDFEPLNDEYSLLNFRVKEISL
jgi:uncharacterized protein